MFIIDEFSKEDMSVISNFESKRNTFRLIKDVILHFLYLDWQTPEHQRYHRLTCSEQCIFEKRIICLFYKKYPDFIWENEDIFHCVCWPNKFQK